MKEMYQSCPEVISHMRPQILEEEEEKIIQGLTQTHYEELEDKIFKLKKLRAKRDELDSKIECLELEIKETMKKSDRYEFSGEGWKVTWNNVSQSRFDQSSFKVAHPKLFEKFKKLSESRRFNLS